MKATLYHNTSSSRSASFMERKLVTVSQSVRYGTREWGNSEINWASCGAQDHMSFVREFAKALRAALSLARRWDKQRAGKPMRSRKETS